MKSAILALTAFLLLGTASVAQEAPASGWAPDEVVVATAQQPGPAFWHIKKGDSEIFILGTIEEMPKGQSFITKHIAEVIEGSHAVLTPPTASAGIFTAGWFLLTHRGLLSMPDGKKLQDTLPPDLKSRYLAVLKEVKANPAKLDDDPPVIVAYKLQDRYSETHNLQYHELVESVEKIAREKHVPMRAIADYSALDLLKEMLRLPLESQQICLGEAVEKIELRNAHAVPLAEAWAAGDLKGMKANYSERNFAKCLKLVPSYSRVLDRAVKDYLKAIDDALAKPGKTVLLTDIGNLLRNTGVADQLRAKGYVIEGPGE